MTPWIQTHSGVAFPLDRPTAEHVRLADIAHALSRIPRFNGHTPVPYTVAQHSVIVSWLCELRGGRLAARDGLFHDAAEAYVGDMVSPLKALVPEFARVEAGVWRAIAERWALRTARAGVVGECDGIALATEAARFFPVAHRPADWRLPYAPREGCLEGIWDATEARDRFLACAASVGVTE